MLHDALWEDNADLARRCLWHPFVQLLGRGELDARVFRAYVAQDAFFLRAFVKAYALALARSPDAESVASFHALIGGALQEIDMHRHYAAELGINLEAVTASPACRAYTDFLLHTAWHRPLGETVSATSPCMRLYAYLGAELAGECRPAHPYRRWIETYSGEDFRGLVQQVDALLDRLAADSREVRDRYRYAMECELEFFSDALRMA